MIEISINAGMDMLIVTARYRDFIRYLKELVNEGRVPMGRIDDAVTRILRVKFALGPMDKSRSRMADRELERTFGSAEHRKVARQAVRESLALLTNEGYQQTESGGRSHWRARIERTRRRPGQRSLCVPSRDSPVRFFRTTIERQPRACLKAFRAFSR